MLLAATPDSYATTLSGYVISALLAVLTAGFVAHSAYTRKRLDSQDASLSSLNASVAVVLATLPAMTTRIAGLEGKIGPLELTTGILNNELQRHLQWHDEQRKAGKQ